MRWLLIASGSLSLVSAPAQTSHIPLNEGWSFRQADRTEWYAADVPGVVHTDLMRHGSIPDPYFGSNVDSVQWIENAEWVYQRTIEADSALLGTAHIDLVFKGLDTFTEIRLNDEVLGTTDNMFRTWVFPIKDLLKPGTNELRVLFRSAIAEGKKLRDDFGLQLPHDNDPSGTSPYVRKAAYHYGWDFCPRLLTCGIWQPVELRCWNGLRIDQVRISQAFAAGDAVVGVEVHLDGFPNGDEVLALEIDGQRTISPIQMRGGNGAVLVRNSLSVKDPRQWWPNGEGEQVLYPVRVELLRNARVIDRWERRIGLRTISLDQHAGAFTFIVNNKPVFCKGANLVPPDMFLPRAGDGAWVRLVADMRRAHFNMVRVWAGGVYPPDAFFDACDTAGIMVWQDFMFAGIPPAEGDLLHNVNGEIRDQVHRLRHHASLALWCGNNELAVAWDNWGWQERYKIHGADSVRIASLSANFFNSYIPKELGWYYDDVPYTPTSPLSNWGNAEGLRKGDLHYWGVWHGDSAFSSFTNNVGRFVSEYGFQSYPDSAMLAHYLPPAELKLGSPQLGRRQRSYKTDRPIMDAIQREFGVVPRTLGEFIVLSQQVQALAYHQAIEAHFAGRPRCMGTLFWQLNDCWPGPSWSTIDFEGNWKPAMRATQEAYRR